MIHRPQRIAWFLIPWGIGYLAFAFFPLVASLALSFTNATGFETAHSQWAGFDNYIRIADEVSTAQTVKPPSRTFVAFKNTLIYVILFVPSALIAALFMAFLLLHMRRGSSFLAMLIILPSLVNGAATALIWSWFMNPEFGLVNSMLRQLNRLWNSAAHGFGWQGSVWSLPDWFYSPALAKPSLVMMSIWAGGGSVWVMFSSLRRIPPSLIEASILDGASPWCRVRHLLWPALTPIVLFLAIIDLVSATQLFTVPYMLWNRSQADSLLVYSTHLYQTAFEAPYALGLASAIAWTMFAALALAVGILFASSRLWVSYEATRTDPT